MDTLGHGPTRVGEPLLVFTGMACALLLCIRWCHLALPELPKGYGTADGDTAQVDSARGVSFKGDLAEPLCVPLVG